MRAVQYLLGDVLGLTAVAEHHVGHAVGAAPKGVELGVEVVHGYPGQRTPERRRALTRCHNLFQRPEAAAPRAELRALSSSHGQYAALYALARTPVSPSALARRNDRELFFDASHGRPRAVCRAARRRRPRPAPRRQRRVRPRRATPEGRTASALAQRMLAEAVLPVGARPFRRERSAFGITQGPFERPLEATSSTIWTIPDDPHAVYQWLQAQ